MSRNEDARRAILGSIRRSLVASAPHDVVHAERHEPPTPGDRARSLPVLGKAAAAAAAAAVPVPANSLPAEPAELFRVRLEAVAGVYLSARGPKGAVAALEDILRRTGATRVAASDSPHVAGLIEEACTRTGAELLTDAVPRDLFDCDVGVSAAQWGIAETGSLVLESQHERHRLVSLIPRIHVALLPADRICETLGEALSRVRDGAEAGEVPSAAITLVTGPSRTSDIELTLAIGVHGPQELHVIVMEPDGADVSGGDAIHPEPGRDV